MILLNGRAIFQRREKESEAARIGSETHFGRPETGIGKETHTSGDRRHAADEGSSQDLRNGRAKDKQVRLHDLREKGTRRLTWCRDQVFEDSDGGRAGPRERVRPKAFKVLRARREWGYASGMKLAPQEVRTYLLTAVTAQRRRLFQVTATVEMFLTTIEDYRAKERLALHAFVVMPEHVHLLLTPAPEVALEKVAQLIKGGFSFRLRSARDVWEKG